MTALELFVPEPSAVPDVYALCTTIEGHIDRCDDPGVLHDVKARLAAVSKYIDMTSKNGVAKVVGTMRMIEVRIGELLPPPSQGRRTDLDPEPFSPEKKVDLPFTPKQISEFRLMSAHKDIVAEVVADSTDDMPATRRAVLTVVKERTKPDRSKWLDADRHPMQKGKRHLTTEFVVTNMRNSMLGIAEGAAERDLRLGEVDDVLLDDVINLAKTASAYYARVARRFAAERDRRKS